MELLVNDLSLHGQFQDLASFKDAVGRLMAIRQIARRFGRALHCHRGFAQAPVTPTMTMPQAAAQALTLEERRALLQWLNQHGPFWEDVRNHPPDDLLECNGSVVTDTAVGEAAWCCLSGIERGLVSLTPSNWEFSSVLVDLVSDIARKAIEVKNYWDPISIEDALQVAAGPLTSWEQLEYLATARYTQLTFAVDAFSPLSGHPFAPGAAQRLMFIFETLNRFKSCFDADGQRTSEGHEIYQNFFTGKKEEGGRGALFSDSSPSEKSKFEAELTFVHPADINKTLFCPWHGKVQTPQLRVHFSSPVRADEPLYVVYVGPKITKR